MSSRKETRVVELEEGDSSWIMAINMEVEDLDNSLEEELYKKSSIYRIPAFAMQMRRAVFTPQVVSFGPFHHGKEKLQLLEKHKRPSLVHFLRKAGRPFKHFVSAMESVAEQLQGAYSGLDDEWKDKDRFIRLMIMDGSFMLQILRLKCSKNIQDLGYPPNDPIFSEHGKLYKLPYIKRDMLLLENQLPLLVLKQLMVAERRTEEGVENEVNNLALQFWDIGFKIELPNLGLHLLDMLRQSMVSGFQQRRDQPPPATVVLSDALNVHGRHVRTAVALHEAGVKFRTDESNRGLNIGFENGILTLPPIVVDDATECMYRNLMTFEHLHDGAQNEISSYICFMDEIIDSDEDVNLLQTNGIIRNAIGSDKEVAKLFNNLSTEVTLDPSSRVLKIRNDLHQYSANRLNMYIANLKHTYFTNPWSSISLVAAVVLLLLTVEQAVYTALSYYQQ